MKPALFTLAMLFAAVATVAAKDDDDKSESIFRGKSPKDFDGNGPNSWKIQSDDNNPWTGTSTAGAVIGFTVFALAYIYTIIYIFYDIMLSKEKYTKLVEDDKMIINQLQVSQNTLDEWAA